MRVYANVKYVAAFAPHALLFGFLGFTSGTLAAEFSFQILGESNGAPLINSAGDVALIDYNSNGDGTLFVGKPGELNPVAQAIQSGPSPLFTYIDPGSITLNGAGNVAYYARTDTLGDVIGLNDDVALSTSNGILTFSDQTDPVLGENGSIYFRGATQPSVDPVNGGSLLLLEWSAGLPSKVGDRNVFLPRGSESGQVFGQRVYGAFDAKAIYTLEDLTTEDYTSPVLGGGSLRVVGETLPGGQPFGTLLEYSVSATGQLAFSGYTNGWFDEDPSSTTGQFGIWAGFPGAYREVAPPAPENPGNNFPVSINADGDVAFITSLESDGALYFNDGGANHRVIGIGDELFGSTVQLMFLSRQAINNDALVFEAALADGRRFGVLAMQGATEFRWEDLLGGDFSNAESWSTGVMPGSGDTAVFALPGTYEVDVDQDIGIGEIVVTSGEVTLDLRDNFLIADRIEAGGAGVSSVLKLSAMSEIVSSALAPTANPRPIDDSPPEQTDPPSTRDVASVGELYTLPLGKVEVSGDGGIGVINVRQRAIIEGELLVVEDGGIKTPLLIIGDNGREGSVTQSAQTVEVSNVIMADTVILGDAQDFGVISGGKGTWDIRSGSSAEVGDLIVGNGDEGTINVSAGGELLVSGPVKIGDNVGSNGFVNVQGEMAFASFEDEVVIGFDGEAELNVFAGGAVDLGVGAKIGHSGALALIGVPGATAPNATFALEILVQPGGEFAISEGANLALDSFQTGEVVVEEGGEWFVGSTPGNPASLVDRGDFSSDLKLQIGTRSYDLRDPALAEFGAGAFVSANEVEVGGEEGGEGRLVVGPNTPAAEGGTTAILYADHLTLREESVVRVYNGGVFLLAQGEALEVLVNEAISDDLWRDQITIGVGGGMDWDGLLEVPRLSVGVDVQIPGSSLSGPLAYIEVGESPGDAQLIGDLSIHESGQWIVEIAGDDPGMTYDQLDVDGDVMIEGLVVLKFIDEYAPRQGDVFNFLNATGAIDLTDATFEIEGLAPGFEFSVSYDPLVGGVQMVALTNGQLVPEPRSLILIWSAIIACCLMGRHR